MTTVVGCSANIPSAVLLSKSSVSSRIKEISEPVEDTLCEKLRMIEFSIKLDETTQRDNEGILMACVQFVDKDSLMEEMLFVKSVITTSTGSDIFHMMKSYFEEKDIPLENIVSCATDGAPAMVGRHRGALAYLRREIPNVLTVHCIIHRQHLVAKVLSERLHSSLNMVIKVVNKIKGNSLNDRLFRELCKENDEEFERLVFHTEVRWLSKGNCFRRVFSLFETVTEFLRTADSDLCDEVCKRKIVNAYLTDFFDKFKPSYRVQR